MDMLALSDLVGTVLAFLGGVFLAVPAFRDYGRRRIDKDLATVLDELGANPGGDEIASARRTVQHEGLQRLAEESRLLKIGVALLTVGLFLSIPVKIREVGRVHADPPAAAEAR